MKGSHWRHMVMFLTLLTVGYVVFRMVMGNFLILGVMEILTGLCVSPLFATGNLIVKDIVPARSLTEGLSGDHRRLGRHLVRVDHRRCRAGRIQSAHEHDDSVDRHPVRGAARPTRLVPCPKTALTSVSHVPAVERDDAEARRRAVNNRLGIRPALVQARAGLST